MTETHPRIYKYGPGWTAAFIGISLAFFAAAAAMVIWRDPIFGKAPYLAWISAAFFGGMGLMGLWSLKCRLILYADHVEYVGLIRRSVVRKAEILRTSGVRRTYTMLELTLELTNGRKMKVGDFGRPDDMFAEWFDAFPNAEAEAEEAQAEALLANPAFGRDEGARQKAIRGDTRLLTGLSGVGWLAGVWGLCDPRPYPLCLMILLVLPVVAFILVGLSRRRWTLGEATNGRLSLAGLGGLPAMVIGLRAMLDDGVVDWKMAAIAGGVLGLGLWILIQAIEGRLKPGALAALAIVCLAYGWGGLIFLNMHFDNAPARIYPVRVLTLEKGDDGNPVTVTAWASRPSGDTIDVGNAFYRKLRVGGSICLRVYPGALRIPWYQYDLCK